MAKCEHLDPENLYHFLSVTNLNVGGMGSIPRTQVCSRLQEEECRPCPRQVGQGWGPSQPLGCHPPSEKSLLELGTDVVSKSLFCQSNQHKQLPAIISYKKRNFTFFKKKE